MRGRVLEPGSQLAAALEQWRSSQKKLVFTNGCFDILHVGHVRYLREARALGDGLIVAINTDESVARLKGPTRPVNKASDRAEVLAALASVDFVTFFAEETPAEIIRMVRPNILVKGGDWSVDQIVGADFVQSYGGRVLSLSFIDGYSTTKIIERSQV